MTLDSSFFEPLPSKYAEYISTVSRRGFDIIQVEFYPLISLGYLLPENVQTIFVHHELRYVRNENEMEFLERVTDEERMLYRIGKDFEHSALRATEGPATDKCKTFIRESNFSYSSQINGDSSIDKLSTKIISSSFRV